MSGPLARLCWALGFIMSFVACSVDAHKNPQRMSCSECKRRGGDCITPQYCVLPSGSHPDAAVSDGGALADSGAVKEACQKENQVELCYEAKDKSTSQQPPCRAGSRTCVGGIWGACEKQVLPDRERCNAIDDDCDGQVDEDLDSNDCDVPEQQGKCQVGAHVCRAGELKCAQITFARAETCNGMDDDCDGRTDEGTQLRCYPDAPGCKASSTREGSYDCAGRCETGTRACVNGKYTDACEDSVLPDTSEHCTDVGETVVDENCDGNTDEGCTCKAGVSCYTGSPPETQMHGPCHAGTQACTDPTHGSCKDQVTPKVEDCSNEGSDDDCDGVMDNVSARDGSCADVSKSAGACKSSARWQCQDGKQVCVDGSMGSEICDGQRQDEDCDGRTDEGFDLQNDEMNCGACNRVCGAGLTCCAGTCVNINASKAHCGKCGGACAGAETCCTGSCTNTGNNASNCGSCGVACGLLSSCSGGNCKLL